MCWLHWLPGNSIIMKPNSQPGQGWPGKFHGVGKIAQLSFARYDIGSAPTANQSGDSPVDQSMRFIHSHPIPLPRVRHSQGDIRKETNQQFPNNQMRQAWAISPRGGATERLSRIPLKPSRPQGHHRHHFDPPHPLERWKPQSNQRKAPKD